MASSEPLSSLKVAPQVRIRLPPAGESAANLTSAATALSELRGTVLVTLISVIFIGAALLIAGIFQIVHAFANKEWGAFLLALLGGALYIVGGLLIAREGIKNSSTAPGHHGNSLTDQAMDQSCVRQVQQIGHSKRARLNSGQKAIPLFDRK